MRSALIFLLTLILLALTPLPGHGQGEPDAEGNPTTPLDLSLLDYKFAHLTTEDGLSNNRVVAILRDSQGFMWFGTFDGLNRYDGQSFRIFRHDPDNANSLSANIVQDIYEDDGGVMWFGTIGGGLSRFDPRTEQFTNYRHNPDNPQSLSNNSIYAISQDPDGKLWIGTSGGGLNQYDPRSDAFVRYQHDPADSKSISHDTVRAILPLESGDLLVATEGGGLNHFNAESGEFTAYRHDPDDPTSIAHDSMAALLQDRGLILRRYRMTEANIIRILIADDHAVVREGLRSYLALSSDIEVVGEATNGWEALELAQAHAPDIILMDLVMPKLNGLDTLRAIQDLEDFSAKTIIITSFSAREQVVEAVKLGASGYLLKDSHPKQIVQAVRDVYYGQTSFHASVTASLVAELAKPPEPTPAQYDLSEREYETLKLIAHGLSNREIAEKMVVSERTVGSHVSNILEKLNLNNRTQAALFALREGIAELDPK